MSSKGPRGGEYYEDTPQGRYYKNVNDGTELSVSAIESGTRRGGKYQGFPTVRLSFAGCNLICGNPHRWDVKDQEDLEPTGDATWVCSAIEEWRDPENTYKPRELVDELEELHEEGMKYNLLLTGGEPLMLDRQDEIGDFMKILAERIDLPRVEVHTNGTFEPKRKLRSFVNHFTVSVKLRNSGMPESKRLNSSALEKFRGIYTRSTDSWDARFQFVVTEKADLSEITEIVTNHHIPWDAVDLVPSDAIMSRQDEEAVTMIREFGVDRGATFRPRYGWEV